MKMLQQVRTGCERDAANGGYLAGLNPQQRRAVEFGCVDLNEAPSNTFSRTAAGSCLRPNRRTFPLCVLKTLSALMR